MKNKKSIIIAIIAAIAVIAAGLGLYFHFKPESSSGGNKAVTIEIVADGRTSTEKYKTSADNLGAVLVEEKIVENNQSEYGLYIQTVYIDGQPRTCDDSKQEWWCITKGGETVMTGADLTPIADGDQFELTLKEGY
ncbi:MAG: hypothetical protein PUB20_02065 [Clostridia bacterium]|nr:hypothetical protein [Clostridia bacterium]